MYKAKTENGTVVGGYTALATPGKVSTFEGKYYSNGYYFVEDKDVVYGTTYSYYLVKKLGDAYASNEQKAKISETTLAALTLNASVEDKKVKLNFTGVEFAEKYEIKRYEIDKLGSVVQSTETAITVPTPVYSVGNTDYKFGYYETVDESVELGKKYKYVLIATAKDGKVVSQPISSAEVNVALSTGAITGVTSSYNTAKNLYFDWTCSAPTCKVYYYTTDNNNVDSPRKYLESGITDETAGLWRCVTDFKNPNTEKK